MEFVINGCRCARISFVDLIALCEREHLDLPTLKQRTGAGTLCKHCRPWLEQAVLNKTNSFTEDSATLRNGNVLLHHFHPDRSD